MLLDQATAVVATVGVVAIKPECDGSLNIVTLYFHHQA
jgi:hypothetical protein